MRRVPRIRLTRRAPGLIRRAVPRLGGAATRSVRSITRRRPTGRSVLAGVLLLAVAAGVVGGLLRLRVDTSTESFLPANDPTIAALDQKAGEFGGDPVVVVLESRTPRQLLLDQRQLYELIGLEGQLSRLPDVAAVYGPGTVLNQIVTAAQDLLAQIGGRRDALRTQAQDAARKQGATQQQINTAGENAVRDFDARYGSLLVRGLPAGLPTLANTSFVKTVVFDQQTGSPRPAWHFVVPNANAVAILVRPREQLDQAGTQRLLAAIHSTVDGAQLTTSKVTITGVPAVTAGLTGQVRGELPLIGSLVALAIALRFLLVPAPGRRLARLRPLAAALIGTGLTLAIYGWLGTPLSFGSIALLPLLLGVGSSFPLYLATVRNRRRVVVMAFASATAFASLAVSPLSFVRQLGISLALGVVLTVLVALALRRGLVGRGIEAPAEEPVGGAGEPASRAPGTRRVLALIAVLVVAGLGWAVLPRLSINANPMELARGLPQLDDALYAQQVLGSSGEVSIVLRGGNVLSPQALDWAKKAETAVIAKHGDEVRPVLTLPELLAFLGNVPTPAQVDAAVGLLPSYLSSAVVTDDRRAALLIFGIQLQDLGAQTRLLQDVRSALPPAPPGYSADLVGIPVAADRGYQLISGGRYLTNLAGIGIAGLVLLLGLRRRSDAVRAVAAAVLATGWGLAIIWASGGSLSPLTVALGSLTTVTGCEFLVLLAEARRSGERWLRRSVAVACLTSMIGYAALAASKLWLLREFGLVLVGAVVLSYLAALTVTWLFPPQPRHPRPEAANAVGRVAETSGTEVAV